jgi:mannobiose 2-epimerase
LLEAFTALFEATSDPLVRARLEELMGLIVGKVVQTNEQYAAPIFRDDWTLVGAPTVSYGHDLETVWLLGDAARALGRPNETAVLDAMRTIGQHAAHRGFDARDGGYFEEGVPQGAVTGTDKIWWVQSEALAGLFWLFRLTADTTYLDRLERTLDFIETRLRDNANPGTEWFWGLTKDGAVNARGDAKGEEWKASYHNSRALTFTERWIARCLAGSL